MPEDQQQQVLQLFIRHQRRIKGFIVSLMGDFAAVEDVLQETFLVIQRKAAEFTQGSNFIAWAFQIARLVVALSQARLFLRQAHYLDDVRLSAVINESVP